MIQNGKRQNPDIDSQLEERAIFYRQAIAEAEEILTLREHSGWQRLKKNIESQLEDVESELDNFEKLDERRLVLRLKERKDFRWVVNLVETIDANLPDKINALSAIEQQLNERKRHAASG